MLRNRKADAVVLIIVVAVALIGGWLALSSDSPGLTGFFSFQPQTCESFDCDNNLESCTLPSTSPSASPSPSPSTPPTTSTSSTSTTATTATTATSATTSSTLPPPPPPPPGPGGPQPGPAPAPPPPNECGIECPSPFGCTTVYESCDNCIQPLVCVRYGIDSAGNMVCKCASLNKPATPPPPPPPASPPDEEPPTEGPPVPTDFTPAEPEYQGPPVVYQPTGAFDRYTNGRGALIAGIILILALMAGVSVLVMRKRPSGKVDVLGDFSKKSATKPHKRNKRKRKK